MLQPCVEVGSALPADWVRPRARVHNSFCVIACAFYMRLFGWRAELVPTGSRDYLTLALGERIEGGVVEHEASAPRCCFRRANARRVGKA